MVSHTHSAVANANGRPSKAKPRRKSSARKPTKRTGQRSGNRTPAADSGADTLPVMKFKSIEVVDTETSDDILDLGTHGTQIDKSQPEDFETVSDPELLALLQQLSETIDTANSVLDSNSAETPPASVPFPTDVPENGGSNQAAMPPLPQEDDSTLPPAASGRLKAELPKKRTGLRIIARAALAGLLLAGIGAWLLHANPSLRAQLDNAPTKPVALNAPASDSENGVGAAKETAIEKATGPASSSKKPVQTQLAALTPPSAELVPMQVNTAVQEPAQQTSTHAPIRVTLGGSAPLALSVTEPGHAIETAVMVQGVPKDARLSQGKDLGSGNWLLEADQLAGVQVLAGKKTPIGARAIEVIAVRDDGSLPQTHKVMLVVEKPPPARREASEANKLPAVTKSGPVAEAAGAKTTLGVKKTLQSPETKALVARGTALLEEGDVSGARLLLEYAANKGDSDAMVTLAQSYDPAHLAKLSVHGVEPDAALAAAWYDRAARVSQ